MKEIGGYLNLELRDYGPFPHEDGVLVNSGRNALEYVLLSLEKVTCLWIPYYTCSSILEPLDKLQIPYQFYSLNDKLEIEHEIGMGAGEYLLYTNYFGIKDKYLNVVHKIYGNRLIIDNSQAFYARQRENACSIYSPRKFFGVPDGGIAFVTAERECVAEADVSYERCQHLLKRYDLPASEGYVDFRENSEKLVYQPIRGMSELTKALLRNVDFEFIAGRRRDNFKVLHEALGVSNRLPIEMGTFACPLVYPYYTEDPGLRKKLIENKIYVATYWTNVWDWCTPDVPDQKYARNIIPLPIDQRYGDQEMNVILDVVNS